jgi:hypothetical protein
VDRSSAVRQLPALHAVAIRLRDEGYDDRVIATALEIDEFNVPMLMNIANSKLTNLMALDTLDFFGSGGIDRPQAVQATQQEDKGELS